MGRTHAGGRAVQRAFPPRAATNSTERSAGPQQPPPSSTRPHPPGLSTHAPFVIAGRRNCDVERAQHYRSGELLSSKNRARAKLCPPSLQQPARLCSLPRTPRPPQSLSVREERPNRPALSDPFARFLPPALSLVPRSLVSAINFQIYEPPASRSLARCADGRGCSEGGCDDCFVRAERRLLHVAHACRPRHPCDGGFPERRVNSLAVPLKNVFVKRKKRHALRLQK